MYNKNTAWKFMRKTYGWKILLCLYVAAGWQGVGQNKLQNNMEIVNIMPLQSVESYN